jgi:hypothetical protein
MTSIARPLRPVLLLALLCLGSACGASASQTPTEDMSLADPPRGDDNKYDPVSTEVQFEAAGVTVHGTFTAGLALHCRQWPDG